MRLHQWDRIPKEALNAQLARQVIHSANMTVARIHLVKGAIVPRHSHENEQISILIEGRLRFSFEGEALEVVPGQALEIPPQVPHEVEALEDSVAMDLFAPRREDWIRGDDAYLRR
jgi:quercetin dioxygenase-like cupin family protein